MKTLENRTLAFSEQQKYTEAKERVETLRKFYNRLIKYTLIIGALGALNYYDNSWSRPWFLWAAFGWGIGITIHAIRTFYEDFLFGKNWEARKIRQLMNQE